ncbi:N-acetylglucosaminyl-phosphatidylinositol de-N-acetylase-like [Paramacrobiotus metropolitanus]|uniref:N-acetylglucosaminyl-phosphatidylinositol de-N-acetylase-like n=1 Tax=Paramacrobiotus metropolitanus TaxID=2943436 RepID=UPI002445935B|nr:N-acetylglucosaminyl-phosphatidylinositol de-N-acetylase-like [Paramacrobiotus metropolitanus]
MAFYLLISMFVGMLVIYKCISWQTQIPERKRKLKQSERLLVVIAHPDDECMFFGPLIVTAVRKWCLEDVFVLCCSIGNHYGMGDIRKRELVEACEILGVHRDNIKCIDDPALPDDPEVDWSQLRLRSLITDTISEWNPSVIATFDESGVSEHRNHRDLSRCLTAMQKNAAYCMKGRRLLVLDTVNSVRKYLQYIDIPITLYGDWDLITIVSRDHTGRIQRAMRCHASQMVWFRWLYIVFSRYMVVNTFREISKQNA